MYFSQFAFTHLSLGARFHWTFVEDHAPVKSHCYFGTAALCCRGLNQRAGRRKCSLKQKHLFLHLKSPIRKGCGSERRDGFCRWCSVTPRLPHIMKFHLPPKKTRKNKHARMSLGNYKYCRWLRVSLRWPFDIAICPRRMLPSPIDAPWPPVTLLSISGDRKRMDRNLESSLQ